MLDYIRDGAEIYRRSFSIIRAEADLAAIPPDLEKLAVRVAHACGMVEIVPDLRFSPGAGAIGRQALAGGAPIVCDTETVLRGITRSRLPADNRAVLFGDIDSLAGAVLAIGQDAAIIDHLLSLTIGRPALVLAFPAGFEGQADAKERLLTGDLPFVTLPGTRGGAAMAASAINALATERE